MKGSRENHPNPKILGSDSGSKKIHMYHFKNLKNPEDSGKKLKNPIKFLRSRARKMVDSFRLLNFYEPTYSHLKNPKSPDGSTKNLENPIK